MQIRILSFSTPAMLAQELSRAFKANSLDVQLSQGDFGNVIPELLQPSSGKYDGLIILMDERGFHDRDWRLSPDQAHKLLEEKTNTFLTAVEAYATEAKCPITINSLPTAVTPTVGYLDLQYPGGAGFVVNYINRRLADLAARNSQITLINSDQAMADIAPVRRSDSKLWHYGRIAFSSPANKALAQMFALRFAADTRPVIKVLALDLDNTMWRGTFGEDGLANLECGDDFPGNAFKALQAECLRLKSQGILLCALSKNDEDVLDVFDRHPGMLLKRKDFAAWRINWQLKPDNIRELAVELNLSLDSFLFLDDSPHEREAMTKLAPDVKVLDMPEDPAARPDALRSYPPAWPLRLTGEDQTRSELYKVQAKGQALKSSASSLQDYLAGLEQVLVVESMNSATLPRLAQMHARTNQFNLTTKRISEAELIAMMENEEEHLVLLGRLSDRFGDHGIVICAVANVDGTVAVLDTFLMSCRVIGREVERAFLRSVLEHLCARGVTTIGASYIPTERNDQTRAFYSGEGFSEAPANVTDDVSTDAATNWLWTKDHNKMPSSEFIKINQG